MSAPFATRLALLGVPHPDSMAAVIAATASAAGIEPRDLLGRSQRRRVAHPRQVAMALCRELPGASLEAVGAAFGRDHTTVHHACRAVERRMTPDLAAAMDAVRRAAVAR